ncbi:MAG: ACP S-malonyltransferase [Planctomycetota bacterium]|nr:ACP S-malonyltransferase [Planctomycetota bacterium]
MDKTVILCPGQGAQVVGMGRDVAETYDSARQVYARADEILGMDLGRLCFEGPAEQLNRTSTSQPAIFVTSVAIWSALESEGVAAAWAPGVVAGLSLGEYTALHIAGMLDFESCLRLVAERGRLMQEASDAVPSGMVSVMGLDEPTMNELCREAAGGEVLAPANFNCPGQIVVSGSQAACERLRQAVESQGGRSVALSVAGAFHSALMGSAADGLTGSLARAQFTPGRIPVVSNVSADYHGDADGVRALLREQVIKPVRWQASMERLISDGFNRFFELGPGRVLSGLMRKIDRSVEMKNISTATGIEKESTAASVGVTHDPSH